MQWVLNIVLTMVSQNQVFENKSDMENAKKFIFTTLKHFNNAIDKKHFHEVPPSINFKLGILYQVYLRLLEEKNIDLNLFKEILISAIIVSHKADNDVRMFLSHYQTLTNFVFNLTELKKIETEHLEKINYDTICRVDILKNIFSQYSDSRSNSIFLDEASLYKQEKTHENINSKIKNDLVQLVFSIIIADPKKESILNFMKEQNECNILKYITGSFKNDIDIIIEAFILGGKKALTDANVSLPEHIDDIYLATKYLRNITDQTPIDSHRYKAIQHFYKLCSSADSLEEAKRILRNFEILEKCYHIRYEYDPKKNVQRQKALVEINQKTEMAYKDYDGEKNPDVILKQFRNKMNVIGKNVQNDHESFSNFGLGFFGITTSKLADIIKNVPLVELKKNELTKISKK